MTSIAPLSVAGLIEFHVLDTDPPILRTYCISLCCPKNVQTLLKKWVAQCMNFTEQTELKIES